MDLVTNYAPAQARQVTINRLTMADLGDVLRLGWHDFLAIPTQLVFLCILYPIVGLVAARAAVAENLLPLLFPMLAGITLLGPVLAVGIYQLSRRREDGLPVSWVNAFDVLRSPSLFGIVMLGVMLLAIFVVWIAAARLIYEQTVGLAAPASVADFTHQVLHTAAGLQLIVFGNLAGAMFAAIVLTLTVVSVPMLLDRAISPLVSIQTSIRAVAANPAVMAAWGVIVAGVLLLGSLPLFVGLAVAMPVLGHATWHLYRKVIT